MPTLVVSTKRNPRKKKTHSPEECTKKPTKRHKINATQPSVHQTRRQRERKKPNYYISQQIPQPPRKRQRKKSPPKRNTQPTKREISKSLTPIGVSGIEGVVTVSTNDSSPLSRHLQMKTTPTTGYEDTPLLLPPKGKKSKKLSPVNNQYMGPEKWKERLTNVPAELFILNLLHAVYVEGGLIQKRKPPKINQNTTWYHYSRSRVSSIKAMKHPEGDKTEPTIIPGCIFYFAGDGEYTWDKKEERVKKAEVDTEKRLQYVSELKGKKEMKMLGNDEEYENKSLFGNHLEKKYSYQVQTAKNNDGNKLGNTLLIAFIDNRKEKYTGNYRTVAIQDKQTFSRDNKLYWNGKKVNMAHLEERIIPKIKRRVYVSNKLKINGTGYDEENVVFLKVADWLTESEIERVVEVCRPMNHAIPAFLVICCFHRMNEAFVLKDLPKFEVKLSGDNEEEIQETQKAVEATMSNAIELMQRIRAKVIKYHEKFSLDDLQRWTWLTWSLMFEGFDRFYEKSERERRNRLRLKSMREMKQERVYEHAEDDEIKKDLGFLHNFLIMIMTQGTNDTTVEAHFRHLSYNMSSIASYLAPLKGMHFCEMLEVFIEISRKYSGGMYTQKAVSFLNVLIITHLLFQGKVPQSFEDLICFRQMELKKTNITRNVVQEKNNVQLGMDRHVNSFLEACDLARKLKDNDLLYVSQTLPVDPAAYLNEICGEIKQCFKDRKKRDSWLIWKFILEEVAAENDVHKEILDRWFGGQNEWR